MIMGVGFMWKESWSAQEECSFFVGLEQERRFGKDWIHDAIQTYYTKQTNKQINKFIINVFAFNVSEALICSQSRKYEASEYIQWSEHSCSADGWTERTALTWICAEPKKPS